MPPSDTTSMQEIELQRHHHALLADVRSLVEKYRSMMAWDIPDNDEQQADRLIFDAIQQALDTIRSEK